MIALESVENAAARSQPSVSHALALAAPFGRLLAALRAADRAAADLPDADDSAAERTARRRVVLAMLERLQAASADRFETVQTFERALNTCLGLGYRARPLAAFVYEVLAPRLAARIRRRLRAAGAPVEAADVSDLVAATAETLARLLRDARRSEYTLRYALLVSIADHRTIDFLRARRRRPEVLLGPTHAREGEGEGEAFDRLVALHRVEASPEARALERQQGSLAVRLRDAVFDAVNALPTRERAALISVDLEGLGYPEVAARLGLPATDVGNVVRRARLLRDKHLVPALRGLPGAGGGLGFAALQEDKELRLQMLRWSAEIGEGFCPDCARRQRRLHGGGSPCGTDVPPERAIC